MAVHKFLITAYSKYNISLLTDMELHVRNFPLLLTQSNPHIDCHNYCRMRPLFKRNFAIPIDEDLRHDLLSSTESGSSSGRVTPKEMFAGVSESGLRRLEITNSTPTRLKPPMLKVATNLVNDQIPSTSSTPIMLSKLSVPPATSSTNTKKISSTNLIFDCSFLSCSHVNIAYSYTNLLTKKLR